MHHKRLLRVALLSLAISSCTNKQTSEEPKSNIPNALQIDIKVNPADTTSILASHIFNEIEYIPLETRTESSFSKIDKISISDDYFIIQDKASNSIYFFFKSGKFSHKITNSNTEIKDSYNKIEDFSVDLKKKEIIIEDTFGGKLITYDFKGKRIKEVPRPYNCTFFTFNNGYSYFYRGYNDQKDSSVVEVDGKPQFRNLVISNNLEIANTYFPYDPTVILHLDLYDSHQAFFISGQKSTIFSMPGTLSAYEIQEQDILKKYTFLFPKEYELPDHFLTDAKFKKQKNKFLKNPSNNKMIWNCTNIFTDNNNMITFNLQSMYNLLSSFIYDTKRDKYINIENIYSDKSSMLLPISEKYIDGSDGNYFYSSVSSKLMFDAVYQLGKTKELLQNPVLSKYFNESNVHSNPVITKFNIKSNF